MSNGCTKCRLHKYSPDKALPFGQNPTDIYFVLPYPTIFDTSKLNIIDENGEFTFGEGFKSNSLKEIIKIFLNSYNIKHNLDITDKFKIGSLVRCTPFDTEYSLANNENTLSNFNKQRVPKKDEIKACSDYLIEDIKIAKPKVIVPIGLEAFQWIMNNEELSLSINIGKTFKKDINGNETYIIPLDGFKLDEDNLSFEEAIKAYNYLTKKKNNSSSNLPAKETRKLSRLKMFHDRLSTAFDKIFHIVDGTFIDVDKLDIIAVKTYDEFLKWCEDNLIDAKEIAYDIETNAASVFEDVFDIIGFSLAIKKKGIYVNLKSLDFEMTPDDIRRCKELLVQVLQRPDKIIVHNCLYEMPATRYNLDYDIPLERLKDTLVMAKLMLGGKRTGAGLKPNAQMIGYDDWETDLTVYIDNFKLLMNLLSTSTYKPVVELMREGTELYSYLHTNTTEEIQEELTEQDKENLSMVDLFGEIIGKAKPEIEQTIKKVKRSKKKEINPYEDYKKARLLLDDIVEVVKQYYDKNELNDILIHISQKLLYGIDNGIYGNVIPYNWIPSKMIERYGATDAVATFDLNDHYMKVFDEEYEKQLKEIERIKRTNEDIEKENKLIQAQNEKIDKINELIIEENKKIEKINAQIKVENVRAEKINKKCTGIENDPSEYKKFEDNDKIREANRIKIEHNVRKRDRNDVQTKLTPLNLKDRIPEIQKEDEIYLVDLHKGYQYMLMEHYTGHCLMMASMKWDEKEAQTSAEHYKTIALKSLKYLIKHPVLTNFIINEEDRRKNLLPHVIFNSDYNDWAWDNYKCRVMLTSNTKGEETYAIEQIIGGKEKENKKVKKKNTEEKDEPKTRKIHIKHINTYIPIPSEMKPDIDKKLEDYLLSLVDKATTVDELKDFFNPSGVLPEVHQIARKILRTPEVRFGIFLIKTKASIDAPGFNPLKQPPEDRQFWKDFMDYLSIDKKNKELKEKRFKELMTEYYYKKRMADYFYMIDNEKVKFYSELKPVFIRSKNSSKLQMKNYEATGYKFWDFFENHSIFKGEDLRKAIWYMLDFSMKSLDDPVQIDIFDAINISPVDTDDYTTWNDTLKWLFNLRLFKKSMKILTAYIEGNSGRKSVYVVNKHNLENGDDVVKRETKYYEYKKRKANGQPDITKEEDYMVQTSFSISAAETGRWSAAFHTMPATSTIKNLFISRFKGGIIAMPDFGQQELRCTASYAQETAMLRAFAENKDIHKANAASMNHIEYDEVSKAQRRVAKGFCIKGDTKIRLLSGEKRTIEDLYNEYIQKGEIDDWVYSYNKDNDKICICKINEVSQNRTETKYIEITLDNGKTVRTTLDHKFILRDGSEIEAQNLKENDSLMATYFRYNEEGEFKLTQGYEILKDLDGRWIPTHRKVRECVQLNEMGEKIPKDAVHHVTFNKLDNRPNRLALVNKKEHFAMNSKSKRKNIKDCLDEYRIIDSDTDKMIEKQQRSKIAKTIKALIEAQIEENKIIENYEEVLCEYKNKINNKKFGSSLKSILKYFNSIEEAIDYAKHYNHKVVSVKIIESNEPVKFYDLSINYCHNFLIDLDDNSGIYIHNSFSILYGSSVRSIADTYFNGNLKEAQYQLDNFYHTFPNLRKWMDSKIHEVENYGKITVLTNRFININYDKNDNSSVSAMSRKAVNFGIQSFSYETKILSNENREYQIGELVEQDREIGVYTYDLDNKLIRQYNNIKAQCTGYTDTWCEVILNNGESIKVTPEHLMMLKTGGYERADSLKIGTPLMTIHPNIDIMVKSINIIHLDKPEPKYDLHVPKYQNFALACGVFTHNSAASTVAAVTFCNIIQHQRKNHLKTKPICFIHDSLESDIAPYELIEVIEYQQEALHSYAKNTFNLALKADMAIGLSMGEECEVEEFEILDNKKTKAILVLKGYKDELYHLVEQWKTVYYKVDVKDNEFKSEYIPLARFFMPKTAFNPYIWTTRESGSIEVNIEYYDEDGNINPINTGKPNIPGLWENVPLLDYIGK